MSKTNPVRKHHSFTIVDFYKEYARKRTNPISYKEYRKIVEDFFYRVHKKIIEEGFIFVHPHGSGTTYLDKFKPGSHKMKRYINRHSYGYVYRMRWIKPKSSRWYNRKLYGFTQISSNKARRLGIGKRGLHDFIVNSSKDPLQKSL